MLSESVNILHGRLSESDYDNPVIGCRINYQEFQYSERETMRPQRDFPDLDTSQRSAFHASSPLVPYLCVFS
jgi:hypothetical protein